MISTRRIGVMLAWAMVGLTSAMPSASAQSGKDFFKNQTVNYVVATAAAGGYDTYGRLIAEFMQRHLPGSTFVVRNMPGAGHLVGANFIALSKPDGLTIGTFNAGLIYTQLVRLDAMKFDLGRLSWIGKAATEPRVLMVTAQTGITSYADLAAAKTPINFATAGVGGSAYTESVILLKALRLPSSIKTGYNGNDDQLAMRRGEIGGVIGSRSSYAQFVANGYGRFIAQMGGRQTDVPQLATFASDDEARALITLVQSLGEVARMTVGPPEIAADRLGALRTAFRAALEDRDLLDRAAKLGLPIEPLYGEDVRALIKQALVQPPRTVELLRSSLAPAK